ncbi:MAG: alpha/beta fold hydrolase [Acidobacteriota bacterium]|nr:alpha/beta fold hydrolase [Acidobacteriota bacterium]
MRPSRPILIACLSAVLFVPGIVPAEDETGYEATVEEIARVFVTLLSEERFAEAVERYDETMKAALPEPGLRTTWEKMLLSTGAFQKQVAVRTEKIQGYDAVFVTCKFERIYLDIKVVLDRERRVAGLFFHPAAPPAEKEEESAQEYARPEGIRETEIVFGDPEWRLPATLTLPAGEGPFPAIALVHGSGPHDRDETVGPNKPFRDLAWGLAARGVVVLRYEKRTLEHRSLMAGETGLTVKEETVDDAVAAAGLLRGTDAIRGDAVFVLGHSLGGMVVPRIAAADDEIAGFVILAGATRQFDDILLEQTEYLMSWDGVVSDAENEEFEKVAAEIGRLRALKAEDPVSGLILGAPASYWLDLLGYEPHEAARAIERPLLILQGERDYQVTMADFEGWKETLSSRDDVTFKVYPGLNHLFIEGKGKPGPAEYSKPGHVSEQVIDDIAEWIHSILK